MKSKTIKISYSTRFQKHNTITVPKLQIEGKWLEEIGFPIGSTVKIEYENNSIHIRPLNIDEIFQLQQQGLQNEIKQKSRQLNLLQQEYLHLTHVADIPVCYETL